MMEALQENPFVGDTNFLLVGRKVNQAGKKRPNLVHPRLPGWGSPADDDGDLDDLGNNFSKKLDQILRDSTVYFK